MAINRQYLENLTKQNVCEVKWVVRHPEVHGNLTRRALITNSYPLLNSKFGINIFNFKAPTQPNRIDQVAHNLVTYFDLFKRNPMLNDTGYRNASCESLVLLRTWSVSNNKAIEDWWIYFRDYVQKMTPQQKMDFMYAK